MPDYVDLGVVSVAPEGLVGSGSVPAQREMVGRFGDQTRIREIGPDGRPIGVDTLWDLDPAVDDPPAPQAPAPDIPTAPPPSPAAPATVDVAALARQASARLDLPAAELRIDPDPADNEWHAGAVGEQLWLWTPDPGPQTTRVVEQGVEITLAATPGPLRIDTGDHTQLTCTRTDRLVGDFHNQPSPSCGHAYQTPGRYTLTATRTWQVQWAALEHTGTLALTGPASHHDLDIIELHSVLVPNR
ncbi:hypothetical protein [Propionibacterium cyclohexanicum]|uniref:hypothetical protein n=1 Tax=Propionibacterium cyclohexanicum TaxID=64702 RepID=UPI00115FEACC|nr:hypothetical protein [Propionibacterium cyclohexanicum]